ncbi:MAG: hypothetical protein RLY21_1991 [Planctomycetota bacterium]
MPPEGTERKCSECGTPYALAEFEFRRGRVKFCCPQCDKAYYGTSLRGHLEPEEFDCIGCGMHLAMERCVVRAHDMAREHEAMQKRDLPWLEPTNLGWFRRWWNTTNIAVSFQAGIARRLTRSPQPLRAVGFVLMNASIAYTTAGLAYGLLPICFGNWNILASIDLYDAMLAVAAIAGSVVATALFVAIPAALCAGLTRRGEPLGFARGYEIAAYSTGALILCLVPCCGALGVTLLWSSQTIGNFVSYFEGEPRSTRILAGVLSSMGFVGVAVLGYFLR